MMEMMMSVHAVMRAYMPFLAVSLILFAAVLSLAITSIPGCSTGLYGPVGRSGGNHRPGCDSLPHGVGLKTLPADMPTMFGKLIFGTDSVTAVILIVGYLYHFLNGASFGLVYTVLAGKVAWYWGIVWGLIIEVLMMTTPPMLLMGVGPFGVNTGAPWYFLTTLAAHIAFGAVLGLLAERFVKEKGGLWALVRSAPTHR
jgi:hypothetical protein